jgi:outer membrane protein assembly factor BamE (lipoprotein component of BamABCDE complex)
MTRLLRTTALFAMVAILTGCAAMFVNSRLREYKTMLDPMLGTATKDDIVARFGMPARTAQLGQGEVWEYRRSFGVRGTGNAYSGNPYNPYGRSTFAYGQTHEVYDQLTFTFDRQGVLQNWQAYVQR